MTNVLAKDMSEVLPTVRVRVPVSAGNPDGILEINRADYDASKHQLVDDGQQPSLDLTAGGGSAGSPPPPAPAPAPVAGDPNVPKGSAVLPANIDVGAENPMAVGLIVGLAHSKSNLTLAQWNELSDEVREAKINAELVLLRTANKYKPPAPGPFSK